MSGNTITVPNPYTDSKPAKPAQEVKVPEPIDIPQKSAPAGEVFVPAGAKSPNDAEPSFGGSRRIEKQAAPILGTGSTTYTKYLASLNQRSWIDENGNPTTVREKAASSIELMLSNFVKDLEQRSNLATGEEKKHLDSLLAKAEEIGKKNPVFGFGSAIPLVQEAVTHNNPMYQNNPLYQTETKGAFFEVFDVLKNQASKQLEAKHRNNPHLSNALSKALDNFVQKELKGKDHKALQLMAPEITDLLTKMASFDASSLSDVNALTSDFAVVKNEDGSYDFEIRVPTPYDIEAGPQHKAGADAPARLNGTIEEIPANGGDAPLWDPKDVLVPEPKDVPEKEAPIDWDHVASKFRNSVRK